MRIGKYILTLKHEASFRLRVDTGTRHRISMAVKISKMNTINMCITSTTVNMVYYDSCIWGFCLFGCFLLFLFFKSPYFICQYMHISSITMTSNTVPKSILVCKQHMNISFQGMFIQCTAQPSPASANICSNCLQRVKALQFVFIQNFFHIVPKHWLWEKKKKKKRIHLSSFTYFTFFYQNLFCEFHYI